MAVEKKVIAIIGAGPVGCAFAVQLINAGHEVTLVGRGQRLKNLEQNGGILTKSSSKATAVSKTPAKAVGSLDTAKAWDLVILTVTEQQCDKALLETLRDCPATSKILFMFNTFSSLNQYFHVIGNERCIMGFPAIAAFFYDGALVHKFFGFGQITITSSPEWRSAFIAAGIPCVHEPDMQSWLRTHAAVVMGIQSAAVVAQRKKSCITWSEAQTRAAAVREGLALVTKLGNAITPSLIYYLMSVAPGFVLAGLIFVLTLVPSFRNNPQVIPHWEREMLGLMDSIIAAAPSSNDVRLISELRSKHI